MKVRVTVCGGGELTSAAALLGLIPSNPAEADLALVDLRDAETVPRAAALAKDLPRIAVVGEQQLAVAAALGVPARSVATSCEPAVLGPLIAAALPPARRRATRSVLVTSIRGGVGRSLLVANLARRLAPIRSTVALDLTGSGALSHWLGTSIASWEDLEGMTDELSAEHLSVVATEVAPGLRILGGPPRAPSLRLTEAVLRAALQLAEVVIVDGPVLAEERTHLLLASVDRVLLLSYDDPISLAALASADLPEQAWILASQSTSTSLAGRDVFRALPRAEAAIAAAASRPSAVGGVLGKSYDSLSELLAIDTT